MRTVYVVKGSEDGIIGVFGSSRSAAESATKYIYGCGDGIVPDSSIADIARDARQSYHVTVTGTAPHGGPCWVQAEIEPFTVQ